MIVFETEQTNDLDFVEKLCWSFLEEGVHTADKSMHRAVVATGRGDLAVMRTVVLRRVDRDTRKLYFHTDMRSQKVQDILATGKLSWLTYDPAYRSQLRMSGQTIIHHENELARAHWAKTAHYSRRCYLQGIVPGTPIDGFHDANDKSRSLFKYTMEESEVGFAHFAVVETGVDWLEWYYTHHTGNRRAVFTYNAGSMEALWQAP